ncbi:MAG TPA: XTP/dITP diphosphatase [Thermodesulfobacteriota bacterium]|jgi:XTP/dITP diphosphohydrolase
MIKEVLLATRNDGKIKEFTTLLSPIFERVISLRELDSIPDIVEDRNSFKENALKKARSISGLAKRVTLADDSGLEVDALDGRPGVFSARYAGESATDKENIKKLLSELSGVADRQARFVCTLALVWPSGREIVVEGRCEGIIIDDPRGENGFGYDPVFFVPHMKKTMAELMPEEKNTISHRGEAVKKLIMCLNKLGISKKR